MIGTFQKSVKALSNKALVIMLFTVTSIFSQEVNYFEPPVVLSGTAIDSATSATHFEVFDQQIGQPDHISLNLRSYVKLRAKNQLQPVNWVRTWLQLRLQYYLSDGTIDPDPAMTQTKVLEVTYNPLANAADFNDVTEYLMKNRYGIRVTIMAKGYEMLDGGFGYTGVPPNIELEIGFECERYYQLTQQTPTMVSDIIPDPDTNKPAAITFDWDPVLGSTEYELEWTWVDNYGEPAPNGNLMLLPASEILFSSRNFETNCTRIKTKLTNYEIPAIYSHGYIIYRFRGVGRHLDDPSKLYFGTWSSGLSDKVNIADWSGSSIEVEGHEKLKNWQFQSSYAEDGKKKEVVSYFDGTLRNRQTVTKVNTDNNAVVGEGIYDNQGRPAVEVLPVPLYQKNYIRYFSKLNRGLIDTDHSYSHYDFDWDTGNTCSALTSGMSNETGVSNYYSAQNQFIGSLHRDYIPNAYNYPFSQVEYTPDNTGRISRKGGVGLTHQLGKGHEMKYFYGTPYQEELNRLFGHSVGYASHYKKNIVIDPNGQASVSYIDPLGRTIATALTGGSPKTMESLPNYNDYKHEYIEVNLLNNPGSNGGAQPFPLVEDNNVLGSTGVFSALNDKLTLSREILVAGNNIPYKFNYTTQSGFIFIPEGCYRQYNFVYNLKLSLKDACSIEQFNEFASNTNGYVTIGSSHINMRQSMESHSYPFAESLNTGSYTLLKELKIDADVLNAYADDYINYLKTPESNCYIPQRDFVSSNADNSCTTDCTDCKTKLGTLASYVSDQLKDYYNNSTFVYSGSGSATFANDLYDYNGDEAISTAEVSLLVQKYSDEWSDLYASCDRLCGPVFVSSCSIDEDTLLSDVSPKGQYGTDDMANINLDSNNNPIANEPVYQISDILSVFNSTTAGSQLYSGGDITQNDWRNPVPDYKDDNSADYYVEIELNTATPAVDDYTPEIVSSAVIVTETVGGVEIKKVMPKYLKNVSDFIAMWQSNWAKSLLIYHPEYCYLEYTRALCANKKSVLVIKTPSSADNEARNLSTDEYDDYLEYIDTFGGAQYAQLADLNGIVANAIYTKDPYFNNQLSGFEDTTEFEWRKNIMIEAMANYEGHNNTMLVEAYRLLFCNSITLCNTANLPSFSELSPEMRSKLWNTYKNLYKSIKGKIKHVFINLYAKKHGCYNGCIGSDSSNTITNVISGYSPVGGILNSFNSNSNPAQLCDSSTAINYLNKQKRFIPVDFGYNSGLTPQAAMNQLTAHC